MPEIAPTGQEVGDTAGTEVSDWGGIPRPPIDEHDISALWSAPATVAPTGDPQRQSPSESGLTRAEQGAGPNASNRKLTILPPPVKPVPTASLHPMQEWEGYVIKVGEDEFEAQLLDLTAGDPVPREEAVIPLEEIDDDDRHTLAVGSVFRWVIGYERSPAGTRKAVSQIVFLDLPPVREIDLERGREWADRLRKK